MRNLNAFKSSENQEIFFKFFSFHCFFQQPILVVNFEVDLIVGGCPSLGQKSLKKTCFGRPQTRVAQLFWNSKSQIQKMSVSKHRSLERAINCVTLPRRLPVKFVRPPVRCLKAPKSSRLASYRLFGQTNAMH